LAWVQSTFFAGGTQVWRGLVATAWDLAPGLMGELAEFAGSARGSAVRAWEGLVDLADATP